eukprot:6278280-Amphidinium_carterae.1
MVLPRPVDAVKFKPKQLRGLLQGFRIMNFAMLFATAICMRVRYVAVDSRCAMRVNVLRPYAESSDSIQWLLFTATPSFFHMAVELVRRRWKS